MPDDIEAAADYWPYARRLPQCGEQSGKMASNQSRQCWLAPRSGWPIRCALGGLYSTANSDYGQRAYRPDRHLAVTGLVSTPALSNNAGVTRPQPSAWNSTNASTLALLGVPSKTGGC